MTQDPRGGAPHRQGADPLDRLTAILIAAVTIVAASAAYLQTDANGHANVANRDAQHYALEALGLRTAGQAEVDGGWYGATYTWFELDTLARTAENDGDADAAARYRGVRDRIAKLSPLLQEPYFDENERTYPDLSGYQADEFIVEAAELSERNTNAASLNNSWNSRANTHILHLTLLAVALALLGLSATRVTWTRILFIGAGSTIVLVTVVWMTVVALGEIKGTPDSAIQAFARGYGMTWRYQAEEAIAAFDAAVEADPSYANAYFERGNAQLTLAFDEIGLDPEGAQTELASGAEDLESARRTGLDDKNVNWNLGFVYYLMGSYDKALAADQRALDEDPGLFPVVCNAGVTHLADGDIEAAREAYDTALDTVIQQVGAAKKAGREPPSSLWLYLHACAADIDSLKARLDLDPRSWTQAPPRELVADSAEIRAEADALITELKSHLTSLDYTGEVPGEPPTAQASAFGFGVARVDPNGNPVLDDDGFQVYDKKPDAVFGADTDEVDVLFDYDGMVEGQKENWKIYLDGTEETSLRVDTTWELGESGGAVLPISYAFSSTFVLRSGEYTAELYIDHHLVQRGTFTVE